MMVSLLLSAVEDRREKRKEEIFALCAIKPRAFFASSKEASSLAKRRKERHH